MWHAWFDVNNLQNRNHQNQQTHTDLAWVKSQDRWIKCNVNARLFKANILLQNNNSEFQGAHTRQFQSQFSTVEGEGMPMRNKYL
jgi:hypothetical protein